MTSVSLNKKDIYTEYLMNSRNIELYECFSQDIQINPQFKSLKQWIKVYLGPATADLHGIHNNKVNAIRDENRNAIIPDRQYIINNRNFYLSVKGCGAYEDMFNGGELNPDKIKKACRDPLLIQKINNLSTGLGFIMAESWLGESPYGAQGFMNGFDELKFSMVAEKNSINGAYICPVIGIVKLPKKIEEVARKFFYFRTYQEHFYQVIRLVPSRARLYFESSHTIADPINLFSIFGIKTPEEVELFELNFIKSGIALLSLFSRSAKIIGNKISGIVYQDVWMDKDCIVAPDGIIHFADLEGLIWKKTTYDNFPKIQKIEWEKLVFEFLFALVKIDDYRHYLLEDKIEWEKQRKELALYVQLSLDKDLYAYPKEKNGDLKIIIEGPELPSVEVMFLEKV
ncbi:MAG: hypothetical protein ACFFBP_07520 [Promethearchaeota archaeon]